MKIICDKCKRDLNEIYQDNMSTNPLFCLCEDCAKKETEDFVMFDNSGIFTIDLKNEIWFDGKNILISPTSSSYEFSCESIIIAKNVTQENWEEFLEYFNGKTKYFKFKN